MHLKKKRCHIIDFPDERERERESKREREDINKPREPILSPDKLKE